jgi:hypothetical protein
MPDDLEKVYKFIASRLSKGRVVPVLGAGVNLTDRPPESPWERGKYLPSGHELASALAASFPITTSRDLAQVAQHITALAGQAPLYDELHAVFDADYPTTTLHRFLARLSRRVREANNECMLIVTTNYDNSLEKAFTAADEPFERIVYVAEGKDRGRFRHFRSDDDENIIAKPNKYTGLQLKNVPVIAKIHGAVHENRPLESYVITEDHYIDYVSRADVGGLFPVSLAAKLQRSHFLFLGYSLRDWNLRVMLYRLWGEQQGVSYNSWAIQPDPEHLDRRAWEDRGVEILQVDCEDFVHAIEPELDRLLPPKEGQGP